MNAENLTQLRDILESTSGATLITSARNDLLRACSVRIARIEDTGKIWLIPNSLGDLEAIDGTARVNLVFSQSNSLHLSVNGIATVASKHSASGSLRDFPLGEGDRVKEWECAAVVVDPQDVVSWNSDASNTVASMFRVAKSYVIGEDGEESQLRAA